MGRTWRTLGPPSSRSRSRWCGTRPGSAGVVAEVCVDGSDRIGGCFPPGGPGRPRIVVGVDGSPGARAALAWALRAAARRGADLEVVAAFPVDLYWIDAYLLEPEAIGELRRDTDQRARAMVAEVRSEPAVTVVPGSAGTVVDVVVLPGGPAENLVQRAESADLLVVGSRGRGSLRSTLLGTVALHVSAHAACPVVVVHSPSPAPSGTVVVGLDNSDHARAALLAAVDEAGRTGARVEAVLAYEVPNYWSDLAPVMGPVLGESREQALERGEAIVSDVLGPGPLLRGTVRVVAVPGSPGEALVRHAADAALLVVGSRSRSRLRGAVLGSVALHCVVHASCPVMVVHRRPVARSSGPTAVPAAARG
ncbi:MAG: universal stress protein [Actinomycetes bacterium]